MDRIFGMMPQSEVEREEPFSDVLGLTITIQAGPHGWTVIFADGGTHYVDQDATTEENFNAAYNNAIECLGELTPLKEKPMTFDSECADECECCEECCEECCDEN